jgi:hypothetical protein
MTEDPTRLIDPGAGAAPLERELLASLRSGGPPEGSQLRVWMDLNRQLAAAGLLGSALVATKSAAASATGAAAANTGPLATKAVIVKWLLGLGLGAVGLGAAVVASRSEAPAPTVAAAPKPVAPPIAAPAVAPEPARQAETEQPRESAPRAPASIPPKADALDRESRLLVAARAALRAGDVARAAAALSELEARFPRGMLGQEREVLKIELMAERGDRAGAARRAERFVAAHPNSPHVKNLSRFTQRP